MAKTCQVYTTERLSAFVDGELTASEAAAVRTHAATCAHCTEAISDLRALVATAGALGEPEPPPTLWPSIAGALARGEPASSARRAPSREGWGTLPGFPNELDRGGRFGWLSIANWRPFSVGALAGAAAVVALVVALPALHRSGNGLPAAPPGAEAVATSAAADSDPLLHEAEAEFAEAAAAYERSIGKLRGLLAREEARWSPQERSRMAERLGRLDDAIARSREVARRTPGDSAGNEQLFAAYQQKIAFLAAAVHRGGEAGEWDKPGARGP